MSTLKPVLQRFEEYFTKSDGCWVWKGSLTHNGYGRFKRNYLSLKAHRVSYELYLGEIPEGLLVLHMCDNPACVNPSHLTVGTQTENVRDCIVKGRKASVLTPADIPEIRDLIKCKLFSQVELGEIYNCDRDTIARIETGAAWKAVI